MIPASSWTRCKAVNRSARMHSRFSCSAKAITDIYYLTHRQTHSDKATRDVLTKLCALFGLLDTTALDIRKAISAEISDFEDAVIVETAVHSGVDCIVTRNTKDYAKAQIAVCTPEEFIQQINEDTGLFSE